MLKVSVFYLEKQKNVIPFLGRSQYQNKKALFTDPIFSDGFELTCKAASGEVSSAIKFLLVIKSSRMVSLSLMLACASRYANETWCK